MDFYRHLYDVHFSVTLTKKQVDSVPAQLKRHIVSEQGEQDEYTVTGDRNFMSMLKYSHDQDVWRQHFMAHGQACPENFWVLMYLLQARHEMAITLGYDNYFTMMQGEKAFKLPGL